MLLTESLFRRRKFKTKTTTLVPVTIPPSPPIDREFVFLTQSFLVRWHRKFLFAPGASCSAAAIAPSTWPNRLAVKPAQWWLAWITDF